MQSVDGRIEDALLRHGDVYRRDAEKGRGALGCPGSVIPVVPPVCPCRAARCPAHRGAASSETTYRAIL